jgi:hypothetical protein
LLLSGHQSVAFENAALRLQLAAFQRKRRRPVLTSLDRLFWIIPCWTTIIDTGSLQATLFDVLPFWADSTMSTGLRKRCEARIPLLRSTVEKVQNSFRMRTCDSLSVFTLCSCPLGTPRSTPPGQTKGLGAKTRPFFQIPGCDLQALSLFRR